jgi:hypothetical protein
MTDNIENLILEQLRAIRADIASVKEDTREIKSRLIKLYTMRKNFFRSIVHCFPGILIFAHSASTLPGLTVIQDANAPPPRQAPRTPTG